MSYSSIVDLSNSWIQTSFVNSNPNATYTSVLCDVSQTVLFAIDTTGYYYTTTIENQALKTWTKSDTPNPAFANIALNGCSMSGNGNYVILVMNNETSSGFYVSSNSGNTFTQNTDSAYNNMPWTHSAISQTGQYMILVANNTIGSGNPIIIRSANYGTTWTSISNFTGESLSKVVMSNSGMYIYAISNTINKYYTSNDYGISWRTINLVEPPTVLDISISASGQYVNLMNRNYLIRSSNYGSSWTQIHYPDLFNVALINESSLAMNLTGEFQIINNGAQVFYSTDFGATWDLAKGNGSLTTPNIAPCALSSDGTTITGYDDSFQTADYFVAVPSITFSTIYNAPVVTSVTPDYSRSMNSNIAIVISGSGFYNVSSVKLDYTNVVSYTVVNSTQINATITVPYITIPLTEFYVRVTTAIGTNLDTNGNIFTVLNNTNNAASCYNKGTQILCMIDQTETYVAIQDVKPGNLVKTYRHGYRRVEMVGTKTMMNCPDKWNNCMYVMAKMGNMTDDLIITGNHSILVDTNQRTGTELERERANNMNRTHKMANGMMVYESKCYKIDDKCTIMAAVSDKFKKIENGEVYRYYHLVIEDADEMRRFGIWANGVLSETESRYHFEKHHFAKVVS